MRILVVDDSEPFRRAARSMLELHGFAVVAEAVDGADALVKVEEFQPDVILLDVQLPGMDGIEVAEQLSSRTLPPHTVLTSSRDADDYGDRLARAPAIGFIPKDALSAKGLARLVGDG